MRRVGRGGARRRGAHVRLTERRANLVVGFRRSAGGNHAPMNAAVLTGLLIGLLVVGAILLYDLGRRR